MPHMRDHSNRLVFKDRYSTGHLKQQQKKKTTTKREKEKKEEEEEKNEMTIVTYSSTYEEPLVMLNG